MHEIFPFDRWLKYYDPAHDVRSPHENSSPPLEEMNYSDTIYGYYIDPRWDTIGSETLYAKLLYVDYASGEIIIELFGEWNDALHNDVMFFKRNIVDHYVHLGFTKFVLVVEQVFNFHGADDEYYSEWFDELEDGFIVCLGTRAHVAAEWKQFNLDTYMIFGDFIEQPQWRTMHPKKVIAAVEHSVHRLLS